MDQDIAALPPEVICGGEALIDFIPERRDQTLQDATRLKRLAGGASANAAVALARLGIRAGFLGKVGNDPFGHFLRDTMGREGVDLHQLFLGAEANTGLAFAWVDGGEGGGVKYLFYRSPRADMFLKSEEIDWDWFGRAKIFLHNSLNLAAEPAATAIRGGIAKARASRQLVCYDVNMRLPAWTDHAAARAGMLSPLSTCEVVKLNRFELAFLTGIDDPAEGAAKLWRDCTRLVIVTLDRDGCYFRSSTHSGFLPGFAVKVADAIGAGDGFMAGLLAYILRSVDFDFDDISHLTAACRYANAAGALATTRAGAIPAMPTRQKVEKLLATGQMFLY